MIEILMGIGILMVLGLLFPRIYGKRATRSMVVKVSGMMYVLLLIINGLFFSGSGHSNRTDVSPDTIPDLGLDVPDMEKSSVAVVIDTIPDFLLDAETKRIAVKMVEGMAGLDLIIRINQDKNIIYVDPTLWVSLTPENKKILCLMSAIYFMILTDDKELRATIKNVHSGKVYVEFKSGTVYYY